MSTSEPHPEPSVFRPSRLGLVVLAVFTLAMSPVALQSGWTALLFLIPVLLGAYLLRVRTVVDTESITVHRAFSSRRTDWQRVSSLRLSAQAVYLVLEQPAEQPGPEETAPAGHLRLPGVQFNQLPELAAASGGRLRVPPEA